VIAANSHVTRDVGAYEIWGGNPARKIRDRFEPDIIELLVELRWWDLPEQVIRDNLDSLCRAPTRETLLPLIDLAKRQRARG
jgi:virginiamycin A acetyltransferase